ncbi:MAG: hypothetical protein DWQ07_25780 [Chloroflexi bacterium]|nr:MAG: hypothetical protein DWQ07_25780 [Chloroflexota bacterium]
MQSFRNSIQYPGSLAAQAENLHFTDVSNWKNLLWWQGGTFPEPFWYGIKIRLENRVHVGLLLKNEIANFDKRPSCQLSRKA